MSRFEQYRHNGEACLALADKARSEEDRECWRNLAQGWFDLAKHTEDHSFEPVR
jgi:hypothetical protein